MNQLSKLDSRRQARLLFLSNHGQKMAYDIYRDADRRRYNPASLRILAG